VHLPGLTAVISCCPPVCPCHCQLVWLVSLAPFLGTSINDSTTPTQVYWYNARTGQTQWHAPASSPCASAPASSATRHADQTAPACRDLREKDEEGGGAKRPKLLHAPACQPHQDRGKDDGGKAEVFDGHSCTPPTSQHLQVCLSPHYLSLNTVDRLARIRPRITDTGTENGRATHVHLVTLASGARRQGAPYVTVCSLSIRFVYVQSAQVIPVTVRLA